LISEKFIDENQSVQYFSNQFEGSKKKIDSALG
jgi:hypothetical protein